MKFSQEGLAFLAIHFTVFLWGFTAILGKLISYGSFLLVWHRMTITFLVYMLVPQTYQGFALLTMKQFMIYVGIGLIVCFHWLAFYGSIKIGDSASVTLACMGSVAFFSSLFEPYFLGTSHSLKDIVLGIVVLVGVFFIYVSLPDPPTGSHISYKWAVIVGLIGAMLASLFTILNKKYIQQSTPLVISAIEMGAGSLFLTIMVPIMYGDKTQWYPTLSLDHLSVHSFRDGSLDLVWVLILSILCTNLTFYLSTYTLNYLSAFTINLTCNMEPIYGILLGALCFHENHSLNREFYLGTCVVLGAIILNPLLDCFCPVKKNEDGVKSLYQRSSYSDHVIQASKFFSNKRSGEKRQQKIYEEVEEEGDEEASLLSYDEGKDESNGYDGDGEENRFKDQKKRQEAVPENGYEMRRI
jgi:drug/metabolite transporter (DMT)-like permease